MQGQSFARFRSSLLIQEKCQNMAACTVDCTTACMNTQIMCLEIQVSSLSLPSTPYIIDVFQSSSHTSVLQVTASGEAKSPGMRLLNVLKTPALCLCLISLILLQLQQHTNVVLSQKLLETGIASPRTPNTAQACPPQTPTTTTTAPPQTPVSPATSVQSCPP